MAKFATNLVGKKVLLTFGLSDAEITENIKNRYKELSGYLRYLGEEAEIVVVNPDDGKVYLTVKVADGTLIQTDQNSVRMKD